MLDSPLISVEQKPSQSSGEGRDGRKSTRWRLCCYLDWGSWWFSYRRTPHCWSLTDGVCETEWSTSPLLPSHPRWIWGITHRPVRWAGNCRSMKLDGAFKASNSNHDTDLRRQKSPQHHYLKLPCFNGQGKENEGGNMSDLLKVLKASCWFHSFLKRRFISSFHVLNINFLPCTSNLFHKLQQCHCKSNVHV